MINFYLLYKVETQFRVFPYFLKVSSLIPLSSAVIVLLRSSRKSTDVEYVFGLRCLYEKKLQIVRSRERGAQATVHHFISNCLDPYCAKCLLLVFDNAGEHHSVEKCSLAANVGSIERDNEFCFVVH